MSRRTVILFLVVALTTGALLLPLTAGAANWSQPFPLGKGEIRPSVAIDPTGAQHYVWHNPELKRIEYSKCTGLGGNGCTPPITLPNPTPIDPKKGESYWPNIAIDPQGRPNVVYETRIGGPTEYSSYWLRLEASGWTAPVKISTEPFAELPDIAIGPKGKIHIIYTSKPNNTTLQIYYAVSKGGFPFSQPLPIHEAKSLAPLTTFGEMAEARELLGPNGTQVGNGFYPHVAADQNDRAHLVWNELAPSYGVRYLYQTGGGWSSVIHVSNGQSDQTPDIAIAPNGTAGIVWGTYDDANAAFAEYVNGAPNNYITDIDDGLFYSLWPRIAADCAGNFHMVFQGKTQPTNTTWNVYYRGYFPATNAFTGRETIAAIGDEEQTPMIATTDIAAIVYNNTNNQIADAATADLGISCQSATNTPTPTTTPLVTRVPRNKNRIDDENPRIDYQGTWSVTHGTPACRYRLGFHHAEPNKANRAVLNFNGTEVRVWFVSSDEMGKVGIKIDGELVAKFNISGDSNATCKAWTSGPLAPGPHTIEIRPRGTTGKISLDALVVTK